MTQRLANRDPLQVLILRQRTQLDTRLRALADAARRHHEAVQHSRWLAGEQQAVVAAAGSARQVDPRHLRAALTVLCRLDTRAVAATVSQTELATQLAAVRDACVATQARLDALVTHRDRGLARARVQAARHAGTVATEEWLAAAAAGGVAPNAEIGP